MSSGGNTWAKALGQERGMEIGMTERLSGWSVPPGVRGG